MSQRRLKLKNFKIKIAIAQIERIAKLKTIKIRENCYRLKKD